jgi:hypothetical protein
MNLLEKAKKIIEWDEHNHYKNLKDTDIGKYAPSICRALLDAMEEIELEVKESRGILEIGDGGIEEALSILRKHLEVEK